MGMGRKEHQTWHWHFWGLIENCSPFPSWVIIPIIYSFQKFKLTCWKMDSPMKIESPTSMSVVFTNQAYEEVENIETVLKSLNTEMEKKIKATEVMLEEGNAKRGNGKGGGGIGIMRGNWKKVRNAIFFLALLFVLMALYGVCIRHWTKQDQLDTEMERFWASQDEVGLNSQVLNTKMEQMEWHENQTVLHDEHLELQRKMLEHSREQNISISKQLEEATILLQSCKKNMDYVTDSYWDYQNSTWNKQEDNRLLQRRIQQLHSQIGIHVDMLGMVSNASNGQLEKTKQLEKELEQKEEKMKGLELRMAEEELMVKTMNETVTTVETTRIAEKRAEVEELNSKMIKLEEELKLIQLMNETNAAKSDLAKKLQAQLAQKDDKIRTLTNLAHSQGKEDEEIRKIFIESKQKSHEETMQKKGNQIVQMQNEIESLKAKLVNKQDEIKQAQYKLDKWEKCSARKYC